MDVPEAKLSIDLRGLIEDIARGLMTDSGGQKLESDAI